MKSPALRTLLPLAILFASPLACSSEGTPDGGTPPDAGRVFADASVNQDAGPISDSGPTDSGAASDAGVMDAQSPDAEACPQPAEPDPRVYAPADCDPLVPTLCSLPWPSNLYLEVDEPAVTGYRLAFGATSLPFNRAVHIDPAPYRRLDGYGLGSPILLHFPNLDAANLPGEDQIEASLNENAAILLFRVVRGKGERLERVPYFAEVDGNEADPSIRLLFVRPAVLLEENAEYVVAVRGLADTCGTTYPKSDAYRRLFEGDTVGDATLAPRQARFDAMFDLLGDTGIDLSQLQLAWDFTTASSESLHGTMLGLRDEALVNVGADGPELTFTAMRQFFPNDDGSGRPVDADIAWELEGEITVPSYLRNKLINVFEGTVLNRDANGVPQPNGTRTVHFWMLVPHSATSSIPASLVQYGHGLLGTGQQVFSSYNRPVAQQNRFIIFGSSLTGFDEPMLTNVGVAVRELSGFEWISETIHQGLLEYLILGRTVLRRLATHPTITAAGIQVDSSALHYSGISQGGIFGATYMALSTDILRGHLGVPGNNYSTLLHRSVDFTPFFEMMATSYRATADQGIALSTVQQLWDTTDPVTYYRHLVDQPLPGTPAKSVLLAPAKGDWQVAVVTNEIVARSNIGIPIMANYDNERTVFGITEAAYPRQGSGIVLWDFGNPWPAAGNLPPNDTLGDPHGRPRRFPAHVTQLGAFLRTGEIIDVCGGDGCHPD